MNSLLLYPDEIGADNRSIIVGPRAISLIATHELVAGIRLRAGVLNGPRGHVRVLALTPDRIELALELNDAPLTRFPSAVIIGVPRPQTVKKILSTASAMGVGEVHFIRSENVEKSYLSSHALLPEEINDEIVRGLEQSGDTVPPTVKVHPRFKPFVEDYLGEMRKKAPWSDQPLMMFGHTASGLQNLAKVQFGPRANRPVILAIGPEAGWSEFEVQCFIRCGFQALSLGPRALRVETALAVFLGEIELLRGMTENT